MASLHSLGQYHKNEMQHGLSCHAMPLELVLASHDAVSILNVTTVILKSRQSKLDVTCLFGHVLLLPLALASYDATGVGVT